MAGFKRCEKGHFYDPSRFSSCPYDGVQSIDFPGYNGAAVEDRQSSDRGRNNDAADQHTRKIVLGSSGPDVPLSDGESVDPAVGWLVCVHGTDKGKDYRIHSENNTIGRSREMDICIDNDDLITRGRHTVLTFDPQNNLFYISPGEGQGLVYLNGKAVLAHEELKPYDEILIGASKLVFLPFCGDKFRWS